MKKERREALKAAVDNNINVKDNSAALTKELIKNPIYRLIGLVIVLILSIIFSDELIKLCALTSDAIFDNEYVLGYVTYYMMLSICLLGITATLIYGLIIDKKGDISSYQQLKHKYVIYSIYDLGGFILSSIIYMLFVITIVITPCTVSGESMEFTYNDKDRVLVWNLLYEPDNYDVVVFDATNYAYVTKDSKFYIKRVIAKEGDVLRYDSGKLYVNDKFEANIEYEDFSIITAGDLGIYTVPKDKLLVMGDNRGNSHDSRNFGLIEEEDVIGKVVLRFYPFNKFGNPEPIIR